MGELVIIHRIDDTWIMTRKNGNFYHILSREFKSYEHLYEESEYRYKDDFKKGIKIIDCKLLSRRKKIETIKSKI